MAIASVLSHERGHVDALLNGAYSRLTRDGVRVIGTLRAIPVVDIEARSLWPRNPPIRFRKAIPTTWIAVTLTEGRNRQVKRMCAAVGFPVLRLVRVSVGGIDLLTLNEGLPLALGQAMPISVDALNRSL